MAKSEKYPPTAQSPVNKWDTGSTSESNSVATRGVGQCFVTGPTYDPTGRSSSSIPALSAKKSVTLSHRGRKHAGQGPGAGSQWSACGS